MSWEKYIQNSTLEHAGILDQNSNMAELRKGTTAKRQEFKYVTW
jgi:hypothetical protein